MCVRLALCVVVSAALAAKSQSAFAAVRMSEWGWLLINKRTAGREETGKQQLAEAVDARCPLPNARRPTLSQMPLGINAHF